jgi:hypothetical protein
MVRCLHGSGKEQGEPWLRRRRRRRTAKLYETRRKLESVRLFGN